MGRVFSVVLLLFSISTWPITTSAIADDWEDCAYKSPDDDAGATALVEACTRIIEAGTMTGEALAATHHHRAVGWFLKRDYDNMIADLDQTVRLNPTDSHAFWMRGLAWRGKSNYDRAISDYTEAIRLNPTFKESYAERGIAKHRKQEFDAAIADFDEAIRLNPTSGEYFRYRGDSWSAKGDEERANKDYESARRLGYEQ
jgi:tetratricopeptide (TPR) repeat protein